MKKQAKLNIKNEAKEVRITIFSFNHYSIDDAVKIILEGLRKIGKNKIEVSILKTKKVIYTVRSSPHKHDAKKQFGSKTHKRLIKIKKINSIDMDKLGKNYMPKDTYAKIKIFYDEPGV